MYDTLPLLTFQSQAVLHDVADYDLRKSKLESLKDRLEALLSPQLVAAFNSHSLGGSHWACAVCGRMAVRRRWKGEAYVHAYVRMCMYEHA